jgi:hypothetical protein
MQMIHHDRRDYNEAATEAAQAGRRKMEALIETGRVNAGAVIEKVTSNVIQDSIVRTKAFKVHRATGGSGWAGILPMGNGDRSITLHNHAWQQVLSDAGIDKRFADKMEKEANGSDWGAELVKHNVDTIFSHRTDQRNLVRESGGVIKGWLSDKFRRLDSRPLLEAFAGACQENGLMPYEGYALETKVRLRAILPKVFEPVKNEVMVVGLEWGNSDYGDGGHVINVFVNRVFCTNLAIMDQALRQIHLGKRLNDDIIYSEETYRKDTEANISALQDVVRGVIGPAKVHAWMDTISQAAEQTVGKDIANLLKDLDKATVEKVIASYESPDVVNLPPGNTRWRLSNAVSWIAQSKDISPEKKLEMQAVAGKLIPHKAIEALAV